MPVVKGIKLLRPQGRPSVYQLYVEAQALGQGDFIRKWQKENNKIATGKSYKGYVVKVVKKNKNSVVIATLSNKQKYIDEVLFGRRAGVRPPVGDIAKWMKAKGIEPDNGSLLTSSYLIARKIGESGTSAPELAASLVNRFSKLNQTRVFKKLSKSFNEEQLHSFMVQIMNVLSAPNITTKYNLNKRVRLPNIRTII